MNEGLTSISDHAGENKSSQSKAKMDEGLTSISDHAGESQSSQSKAKLADDMNTFMTMLTTQLKNQDPLSPMDSTEFTNQLVQFASVEQNIHTNENLEKLNELQQANLTSGAVNYMGKEIQAVSNKVPLQNGSGKFTYTLDSKAENCTVAVKNEQGQVVRAFPGEKDAGTHTIEWNGKDSYGNDLPDGPYKISITAMGKEDGENVEVDTTAFGKVSAIANDNEKGKMLLSMDGLIVDMEKVLAVHEPTSDTGETE